MIGSGSIQFRFQPISFQTGFPDITAHLIHDKTTSLEVSCTVFNVPSAGNDPGWIYWSFEFLFFRPRGLWTQRPAQTGPGCQNLAFQRFEPIILCSFSWRLRKTTLESHNSKQMMVYEQITFFIKKRKFSKCFFGSNIDFLIEKSISLLKKPDQKPGTTRKKLGQIAKSGSAEGAKPLVFDLALPLDLLSHPPPPQVSKRTEPNCGLPVIMFQSSFKAKMPPTVKTS